MRYAKGKANLIVLGDLNAIVGKRCGDKIVGRYELKKIP